MVEPRENRIHMYLSNNEMEAIDDWRFANRVATRSDAIRRLCQMALVLDSKLTPIFEVVNSFGTEFADLLKALPEITDPDSDGEASKKRALAMMGATSVKWMRLQYTLRDLTGRAYDFKHDKSFDEVMADAAGNKEFFEELIADTDGMLEGYERIKAKLSGSPNDENAPIDIPMDAPESKALRDKLKDQKS